MKNEINNTTAQQPTSQFFPRHQSFVVMPTSTTPNEGNNENEVVQSPKTGNREEFEVEPPPRIEAPPLLLYSRYSFH